MKDNYIIEISKEYHKKLRAGSFLTLSGENDIAF